MLETIDVEARLRLVLGWARETLADLTLRERIKTDVEEGMEKTQREFLLRRQLEAIRKELGELGDEADEGRPTTTASQVDERELPDAVRTAVVREIDKLERTSEQSPEHGWIRTWLDTVLELPWGEQSEDRSTSPRPARILDEDHDGLRDVKDRILEHLAVRKLQAERGLVPVGRRGAGRDPGPGRPPGVGKTSLGESVARALGRSFVRVALGGVRDEAEIRGHRRTYVGAQPGRLRPGPPRGRDDEPGRSCSTRSTSSAPTTGATRPRRCSRCSTRRRTTRSATTTSRSSSTCPRCCSSRRPTWPRPSPARCSTGMEVIRLDGYTEDEKVAIARHHLLRRQLERAALPADEVEVTDEALRAIVADYTREAGVRSLERELGRLLRKVATKLGVGRAVDARSWSTPTTCAAGSAGRASSSRPPTAPRVPGVATGLAVTGAGGDVLFVEATMMDGPEGLTLTGQLGDVMKESAEIALSYVRSHASELGIDPAAFAGQAVPPARAGRRRPEGRAVGRRHHDDRAGQPAARPSRCVPSVGMTGEVTLQGRVLPIGGVQQKVLAAHRAGLTTVVLPVRNGPDLEDVPEAVRDEMTFHLAETVGDVLGAALDGAASDASSRPGAPRKAVPARPDAHR